MAEKPTSSSSRFLFQSFFIGLAACGFLVILMDLSLRAPGLGGVVEPIAMRFFPEVENGLGLLISSLILLGIGYLPSLINRQG